MLTYSNAINPYYSIIYHGLQMKICIWFLKLQYNLFFFLPFFVANFINQKHVNKVPNFTTHYSFKSTKNEKFQYQKPFSLFSSITHNRAFNSRYFDTKTVYLITESNRNINRLVGMCKSEANLSRVSLSMSEEKDLPRLAILYVLQRIKISDLLYFFIFPL